MESDEDIEVFNDMSQQLIIPSEVSDAITQARYTCALTFGLAFPSIQAVEPNFSLPGKCVHGSHGSTWTIYSVHSGGHRNKNMQKKDQTN